MLDRVRSTISNLPDISFEEYFIQYMMSVQDSNIESEASSIFKNVSPDVSNVIRADRLVSKTFERLVK